MAKAKQLGYSDPNRRTGNPNVPSERGGTNYGGFDMSTYDFSQLKFEADGTTKYTKNGVRVPYQVEEYFKNHPLTQSELMALGFDYRSLWEKIRDLLEETDLPYYQYYGYADGGVLTAPTVGLMAEYPGASYNPEIVTP